MTWKEELLEKICEREDALEKIESWKAMDERIVFTNGCFDLLHRGHLDYLSRAADLGDRLVIGLNSDVSVRNLKGKGRPVNDFKTRSQMLANLAFTDLVVPFNEDTPYNIIEKLLPDCLVKGGDYQPDEIIGADIVDENGGEILVLPFLKGFSSTQLIEKIKRL